LHVVIIAKSHLMFFQTGCNPRKVTKFFFGVLRDLPEIILQH